MQMGVLISTGLKNPHPKQQAMEMYKYESIRTYTTKSPSCTTMKIPVVLVAAFVCYAAGLPAINQKIIGGNLATAGQFPYVVSITENDKHFCGGFIYAPKWIVTSASCVVGKLTNKLKVVAGQLSFTEMDEFEQPIGVYSVYIFDQYNSTNQQNDIALLQLIADIKFDDDDDPSTPPPPGYPTFVKYNEVDPTIPTGTVAGWGARTEGGPESINLHYGSVNIDESATCGDYSGPDFSPSNMICATTTAPIDTDPAAPEGAGSPCQYDEGSPLIQEKPDPEPPAPGSSDLENLDPEDPAREKLATAAPIVVGIVSKFKGCQLGTPSVFTRISVYYYWLIKIAGLQPSEPTEYFL